MMSVPLCRSGLARRCAGFAAAFLAMTMIANNATAGEPPLAGVYDGGQTELAAGLELHADGRFHYALSYGALDEEAAGTWSQEDGAILLTSDPVTPPRFVLVEQSDAPTGLLRIALDLPPGLSRQYFRVQVRLADGTDVGAALRDDDEPLELAPDVPPVAATLELPLFGLRSDAAPLGGVGGHHLRFRFEPHDLGKVAFSRTPLRIEDGALLLVRHDRLVRFRRVPRSGGTPPR